MKVFISWSGERSEALAKALREWFPLVLHFVDPWLSKSDIQPGDRWSIEIAKELEACNFGVICITRENLSSPWILFESGALAKSMQDGRVIPLLLDLDFKEVSGPLAQFQAKKTDIAGIKELVITLNKASSAPVPDTQLDRLFIALWGDLERQISSIPKATSITKHTRPQAEILEELVSGIRSVEMRVRDVMDDEPMLRRRRRPRFHPSMMHEFLHRIESGPNDPIQILFVASFLRDDVPWLYELALDAYRAMKTSGRGSGKKEFQKFIAAFEALQRGPFAEDLGLDRMTLKMIRSEFFSIFDYENFRNDENVRSGIKVKPHAPDQEKE